MIYNSEYLKMCQHWKSKNFTVCCTFNGYGCNLEISCDINVAVSDFL